MNTSTQTYQVAGDVPFTYELVSDSQDVQPLNEEFGTDYDSFFIRVGDGDYLGVYGMYGIIPTLNKRVYQVL